jgi:hypothetical protein
MDWFFLLILIVLVGAAIWAFKGYGGSESADGDETHLEHVATEELSEPTMPPATE